MWAKKCLIIKTKMNAKKMFSWLLLLFGEALIIICFLYFGRNIDSNVLILNIVVSSVIYLLWFVEKFVPMIDLKDKAHKDAGSIGLKWVFTIGYAILAISAMVVLNLVKPLVVDAQIIIHLILFFFLLVGLYFVFYSSQKVQEVFTEETRNRSRVNEMKTAIKGVKLKLDQMNNVPSDITDRITVLLENMRYISPSNNIEAIDLESTFMKEIKDLQNCLFDIPLNHDQIKGDIQKCEQTYNERKTIFSN